jgi:hypothetical protein
MTSSSQARAVAPTAAVLPAPAVSAPTEAPLTNEAVAADLQRKYQAMMRAVRSYRIAVDFMHDNVPTPSSLRLASMTATVEPFLWTMASLIPCSTPKPVAVIAPSAPSVAAPASPPTRVREVATDSGNSPAKTDAVAETSAAPMSWEAAVLAPIAHVSLNVYVNDLEAHPVVPTLRLAAGSAWEKLHVEPFLTAPLLERLRALVLRPGLRKEQHVALCMVLQGAERLPAKLMNPPSVWARRHDLRGARMTCSFCGGMVKSLTHVVVLNLPAAHGPTPLEAIVPAHGYHRTCASFLNACGTTRCICYAHGVDMQCTHAATSPPVSPQRNGAGADDAAAEEDSDSVKRARKA